MSMASSPDRSGSRSSTWKRSGSPGPKGAVEAGLPQSSEARMELHHLDRAPCGGTDRHDHVHRALAPRDDAPSRAGEGAAGEGDVIYVAIHDKEGAIAGVAGRTRAPRVSPLRLPSRAVEPA